MTFPAHSNSHGDEALLAEGRVAAGGYFVIRGDGADGSSSFGDRGFFNVVLKKVFSASVYMSLLPMILGVSLSAAR